MQTKAARTPWRGSFFGKAKIVKILDVIIFWIIFPAFSESLGSSRELREPSGAPSGALENKYQIDRKHKKSTIFSASYKLILYLFGIYFAALGNPANVFIWWELPIDSRTAPHTITNTREHTWQTMAATVAA
jgi:hypothetical protein